MKFSLLVAVAALLSTESVSAQKCECEAKAAKESGLKGFHLTNDFRRSQGKKDLTWSDGLYDLATKHNTYQ